MLRLLNMTLPVVASGLAMRTRGLTLARLFPVSAVLRGVIGLAVGAGGGILDLRLALMILGMLGIAVVLAHTRHSIRRTSHRTRPDTACGGARRPRHR